MMELIGIGLLVGVGAWLAPILIAVCIGFIVFLAAMARIIYLKVTK